MLWLVNLELFISTGYRVHGILYVLDQLKGACHTHISYHDTYIGAQMFEHTFWRMAAFIRSRNFVLNNISKPDIDCPRSKHVHLHGSETRADGSGGRGEDTPVQEGLRKYAESCWLKTHASLQNSKMLPVQQSTISARHLQVFNLTIF